MSKGMDLTGQRFGKLTALEIYKRQGGHKPILWRCICDCGNEKIVNSQNLKHGIITDCGCRVKNRLVGERFGKLTVLEASDKRSKSKSGGIYWKCRCDCGNIVYVQTSNLVAKVNRTMSCGCHKKEQQFKHGKANSRIYKAHTAIKQRCYNHKCEVYNLYGGRGITVCDEWLGENGFINFYNWSMSHGYADNLTIDRIDNDKGYLPDNCRWVSQKTQMNNTRRNHYVEINGETHSLTEWAEIKKISVGAIRSRIKMGWTDIEAINTPIIKHGYTRTSM